jgi:hypothetical protein
MALENEAPKSKPMLNLSRRAKRPVRKKRLSSSSKPSTKSRLPIPSFAGDIELDRLEKAFFKDSDSDNEVDVEPQKPKAAVIASKLPAPDFVSCLDSDGDDDEDDLLAPSIFAKKSVPAPPIKLPSTMTMTTATTTTTTTTAGVELPRSAGTKPIISSPARPYENDDLEDGQGDEMAAPWSASSKDSSKINSGDGDSSHLLQCVDRCFRKEDLATVTFNKISSAVERELSIKLQPEQRKIVRARLMSLIEDSPVKTKSSEQPTRAALEPAEQPTRAVLEPAVDAVLSGFSDKGKCTIKEIMIVLQSQFGAIFTEETKIIVRKRLIYTLNNPSPPAASTGVVGNKTEPLASLEPNRQQEVNPVTSVGPVSHQHRDDSTTTTAKKTKEVSSLAEAKKSKKPSKSLVEKVEAAEPNTTVANQKTKGRKPPNAVNDGPIDGRSTMALPSLVIEAKSVEETVVPGKDVAPERKKRGRPSQPADTVIAPVNNNSYIPPVKAPRKAAPARAKKRAKGSCSLCSNCPCTNDTAECNAFDAIGTVQSDAAQEKDLMKRLMKLEKTAEAREEQADAVRRKLKKHRRDMWRKHEATMQVHNTGWPEQSRFLPDVKELDKRLDGRGTKGRVSTAAVQTVQSKMFSFAQSFQPTLTQMFSGGKKAQTETTEDENLDTFESANLETIEEEPDGEQVVDFDVEAASNLSIVMDAEDASMLASDEEDGESSEGVEVDAHRTEWKGGAENSSPVVSRPSIWRSLMTGGVECTWDRLFDEDVEDESTGIDHLLDMLDDPNNDESVSISPTVQAATPVQMEMLSQRGQLLAEEILGRIESDNDKVEILEAACPNWKENIIFALFQQESEDVHEALERVKRSKAKLLRVKQEIMESAQRQEAVLNVFEDALRTSLSRVQGSSEDADADGNEGFFPTQAPESPLRTIFDGEEDVDSSPTRTPDLRRHSNITVLTNVEDDLADFTPDNDTAQDTAGTVGGIEQETNPSSPFVDPSTPLNCGRQSLAHSVASGDTTIAS